MGSLRKVGILVGALAMVGSLLLVFYPFGITPLDDRPRSITMVWQSPYGALGAVALVVAGLIFFGCLPRSHRLDLLGGFLALSSIGLAAGFLFNDYHAWWWHTAKVVFPLGVASAAVGGFLIARALTRRRKVPLWAVLPAFLASIGLATALVYGFMTCVGPTPNRYIDYNGDYFSRAMLIMGFQVLVSLGLFAGFVSGLISSRLGSSSKRGFGSHTTVHHSDQGLLP